ncbi:MAG: NAD(P)H-hydrate dehydratase [Clostridiales bacterium]|nr:NAD(P)H-hydrate dehydratase [Clostridiales bacterium]
MYYALDSNQIKEIDNYTIKSIGIPSLVLMERAALEVANHIKKKIQKSDRILAICGNGNNGGDGIAAGRILFLQGYQVAILFIGKYENATEQTKRQLDIAKNMGIPIENNNKLDEYNIIIDAIFGVGLSRPVTGEYADIIEEINRQDASVFSVDMPSGISADDGRIHNVAVRADETITIGFNKLGLLLYPGAEYAGDVTIVDIGYPDLAFQQVKSDTFYYGDEDLKLLPKRKQNGHKGTFGKVLVIAGSKGMSGAAYFSAKAAYKTGAGLVKILTSSDNRQILQTLLPEALLASYDESKSIEGTDELLESLSWASVIVIGPGLGQSEQTKSILCTVIKEAKVPVIIDADGLNLLAKIIETDSMNVETRINSLAEFMKAPTILTPHLMELSRLLNIPVTQIKENIIDTAKQCSYNNKLIYVIKDVRTIVTHKGNHYINLSGNHGMATGGSGDVLTGIIAALVAQGMAPYDAACLGVYLHGLAGNDAARNKGPYSMIASDILTSIENVIKSVE